MIIPKVQTLFLGILFFMLPACIFSQSFPDRLTGSGLLLFKELPKNYKVGNVGLDFDGAGKFVAGNAIPSLANSGTVDDNDIAACISSRISTASTGFQKRCVAELFDLADKSLAADRLESLRQSLALAGSSLSAKGIHPLAKKNIYFVPDGSGTVVRNPQAVTLYNSGKMLELNVSQGKSYKLKLPDGRIAAVGHAMYHENGMVSFVSVDPKLSVEYAGKTLLAWFIRWDPQGNICGLDFENDRISLTLPDGTETTDSISFSYWTLNKKPGILERNDTLTDVSFRQGNSVQLELPNGQTIDGNIASIHYYDNGKIQSIHLYPYGNPIEWILTKPQPVGYGEKWEKRTYYERVNHLLAKEKIFSPDKAIVAHGGIQLTPDGEIIAYWDKNE